MSSYRNIRVSLPSDLVLHVDRYRRARGLASRSEVLALAVKALREAELAEGYRALADEYQRDPDPLIDAGIDDGLELSTEEEGW